MLDTFANSCALQLALCATVMRTVLAYFFPMSEKKGAASVSVSRASAVTYKKGFALFLV